jgi:hypothetical protein
MPVETGINASNCGHARLVPAYVGMTLPVVNGHAVRVAASHFTRTRTRSVASCHAIRGYQKKDMVVI